MTPPAILTIQYLLDLSIISSEGSSNHLMDASMGFMAYEERSGF